jgi:4'-phosphopantetheinyl transferase
MLCTVNVYYITISSYLNALEALYSLLSTQEKIQSKKFFTINLSNRYIVTRAVLRSILAEHLGTMSQDIEFVRNSYGKPFVKGVDIEFNMSHSYDAAYYAVASDFSVGIDVELYNEDKNIFDIAKSVFSADELARFLSLPDLKRKDFFFNAWTKKEAAIKAMGLGLAYPMEKVNTMQEKREGHMDLSGDKYYLHALNSNSNYKAHLVVKNKVDIV